MSYTARLLIVAAVSAAGHLVGARVAVKLPRHEVRRRPAIVSVEVRRPMAPDPPPERAPEPEPEQQTVHEVPSRRRVRQPARAAQANRRREDTPAATERPTTGGTGTPVFGISMESTSQAGKGPSMPVGNTVQVRPGKRAAEPKTVKPLAGAPAPAWEVTKMPLPRGTCSGKYTEQARRAGIEGTVVLDLVVGENGAVRQVKVVRGLGHGLTEAAVRAAKACRFSPGERKGKPVPVRVRQFRFGFSSRAGAEGAARAGTNWCCSIGPAFYGLRSTLVTLLMMALLRIKRAEGLKEHSPRSLGRLLGLDRSPEVKTLRRKLAQAPRHDELRRA